MIARQELVFEVKRRLRLFPVCVLLGPRQSGKTTLANKIAAETRALTFDLETDAGQRALEEPELALRDARGLVVIDEVQRNPDVFRALRSLVDRRPLRARFLLLGSASLDLVRGVSESLAGRVTLLEMSGFSLTEISPLDQTRLWLRGGFPRSFLARSEAQSFVWRTEFIRTFLERDIPELGLRVPSLALRRFWTMVAHFHGGVWNAAEFARSLGRSEPTARHYLDILSGTYVARQLAPWFENIGKRQVKAPKIFLRDSGLLHALLGISSRRDLLGHIKVGASWEGFALQQIIQAAKEGEFYFWSTHAGAELDLLWIVRGKRYGFEFKASTAPKMTKSLAIALADLALERAYLVGAGDARYAVHERVEVVPLAEAVRLVHAGR